MKISNESKIGVLAVVSITLLIIGFNFLKGKKLFADSMIIVGKFSNVQGLANSNPVMINGLQVGTVYSIKPTKDMHEILVNLNITSDLNIPNNSIAIIKPNPIGITMLEIKLGDSPVFLKSKEFIITEANAGLFSDLLKKVDPVLYEMKNAVKSIDSFILKVNNLIDPAAKNNFGSALNNLNKLTGSLILSAASLESLLNNQTGALSKSMNNLNTFTGNLATNNEKITSVLDNLDKTTNHLSQLDLQKTLTTLDATVTDLNKVITKFNTGNGTIGMLINDPALYRNLSATSNKLNLLLDDFRMNPKRYVNISVFGKKNKNAPLMIPLPDTVGAPYIIDQK